MKNRFSIIVTLSAVIVAGLVINNLGTFIMNVPRERSGPLRSTEQVGDKLRIFVLGDTGTGQQDQKDVAAAMEKRCNEAGVDALFFLGDNIYHTGVTDVDDPEWDEKLWNIYSSPCLRSVPIYPVLGNHDYRDSPAAQIEYSLKNSRWRMPNRFYSVEFGYLLKLVAFDSQISEVCFNPNFCALDFLVNELDKHTTVWNIVTAHHPIESASIKGYGHRGGLRGLFLKPLLCNRTDLYMAGHAHHMEYRRLDDCRMDLAISGGGGATLYDVVEDEGSTFAKSAFGFMDLELTKTEMLMKFIGKNGNVIYTESKSPQAN